MMKEQLYAIYFTDSAVPSFCSFPRMYVGTLRDIGEVMERLKTNSRSDYPMTLKAWEAYQSGDHSVTHNIAFGEFPLLQPVTLIRSGMISLGAKELDYHNMWDYLVQMRFDAAIVTEIIVKLGQAYAPSLALQRKPRARKSMLVQKTRLNCYCAA